jgi:exodeoxyribonuclease VII large subunit
MSVIPSKQIKYLSVSEVSRAFNKALEDNFREVFMEGEISEISRPSSGHIYFTVKDEKSQLSCVMWKGMQSSLQFQPKAGIKIVCHGKPNIYNVSGRLQVVVHFMALAGEGLLQKKFLELKAKLEKEGLFAPERKRYIPFLPKIVGVVTSAGGAVIHDIMVKIIERMPNQKVALYDAKVQGDGAAREIADGIECFNTRCPVDVIIVARGGGSLEDLWAFNEEITVRAIFASRVPVVSGVGHEVDVTLSDLVADVRAPTPTAAAEMVVPRREDLLAILNDAFVRLSRFERWLSPLQQRLDDTEMRLTTAYANILKHNKLRIDAMSAKVQAIEPKRLLKQLSEKLDGIRTKLVAAGEKSFVLLKQKVILKEAELDNSTRKSLRNLQHFVDRAQVRLDAISPKKVLARGYAFAQCNKAEGNNTVVTNSQQLEKGDMLKLHFYEGAADVTVEEVF